MTSFQVYSFLETVLMVSYCHRNNHAAARKQICQITTASEGFYAWEWTQSNYFTYSFLIIKSTRLEYIFFYCKRASECLISWTAQFSSDLNGQMSYCFNVHPLNLDNFSTKKDFYLYFYLLNVCELMLQMRMLYLVDILHSLLNLWDYF